MINKIMTLCLSLLISSGLSGCNSENKEKVDKILEHFVIKDFGFMEIEKTPSSFKDYIAEGYTRYVGYKVPNGKKYIF